MDFQDILSIKHLQPHHVPSRFIAIGKGRNPLGVPPLWCTPGTWTGSGQSEKSLLAASPDKQRHLLAMLAP
jgi:hypothetical protein